MLHIKKNAWGWPMIYGRELVTIEYLGESYTEVHFVLHAISIQITLRNPTVPGHKLVGIAHGWGSTRQCPFPHGQPTRWSLEVLGREISAELGRGKIPAWLPNFREQNYDAVLV